MQMKNLIIICEGSTEQRFVQNIIAPHLLSNYQIMVSNPLIKKTGGGIVSWQILKKQITNHLKQQKNALVTTFIDYYGIKPIHYFPDWKEAHTITNKPKRMETLEQAMKKDIEAKLNTRFIPYIQLHEFEGLLFNDFKIFEKFFNDKFNDKKLLEDTLKKYKNPEDINNGKETAPSKRLSKIITGYHKVLDGDLLAQGIELKNIRSKAPRFNDWMGKLEKN